jgi:hypothetical protein
MNGSASPLQTDLEYIHYGGYSQCPVDFVRVAASATTHAWLSLLELGL